MAVKDTHFYQSVLISIPKLKFKALSRISLFKSTSWKSLSLITSNIINALYMKVTCNKGLYRILRDNRRDWAESGMCEFWTILLSRFFRNEKVVLLP